MYYRDSHFRCGFKYRLEARFSSNQGAWLHLAVACPPRSIACSDWILKCPCNEENWRLFFPHGLISVCSHDIPTDCSHNCNSKPENVTAIELLDAIWEKCSRIRKNKQILSLVQHLLIQADRNRIHLDIVTHSSVP